MPSHRLRKGMYLMLMGREYVIERRLPNRELQLKDVAINEYRPITEDALTDALFDGHAELLGGAGNSASRQLMKGRLSFEELSLLDDDDPRRKVKYGKLKKDAKRRFKYAMEIQGPGL